MEISGATGATLELTTVRPSDAGRYDVVIGSDCGAPTTSRMAEVSVVSPPAISRQPVGRSVAKGESVWFTVRATGPGRLARDRIASEALVVVPEHRHE